jgi:putative transposase
VRTRHPFEIEAAVILPDHLHVIWTLPDGDADFATLWRLIKSGFSRALRSGERISASRAAKAERGIWQRRYWEHKPRDEDDFGWHLNCPHFNPVKHGDAVRVRDSPFYAFRRRVRLGAYPVDWAGDPGDEACSFGERDGVRCPQSLLRFNETEPRAVPSGWQVDAWCEQHEAEVWTGNIACDILYTLR